MLREFLSLWRAYRLQNAMAKAYRDMVRLNVAIALAEMRQQERLAHNCDPYGNGL